MSSTSHASSGSFSASGNAITGDDRSSQQALRILVEIGKVTGVAAPIQIEATGPDGGPIQHQVLQFMPDAEWLEKYAEAWESVRQTHPTLELENGA